MQTYTNEQLVEKVTRMAEKEGLTVRRVYTSRGMSSHNCIGIYGEDVKCRYVAEQITQQTGEPHRIDNMGRDTLCFFIGITY